MEGFLLAQVSALWLGVLTSISPCPLATNIAAVSFVARHVGSTRRVLLSGALYTAGRTIAYLVVAAILTAGLLSIPELANLLQRYMNKVLGPVLIVAGMFLLEMIGVNLPSLGAGENLQKRAERWGVCGAGLLGMLFALSFCPFSAALFFGGLIPLCVKYSSVLSLPAVFGIGTALPVFLFAILIAVAAQSIGKAFDIVKRLEVWVRRATGIVFILIGGYYTFAYVFEVL